MKIYTCTGDRGTTSLSDGSRISKSDILLHAYGTVDELNSFIGAVISQSPDDFLTKVQNELFVVGGMLATPAANWEKYWNVERLAEFTKELELEIDRSFPRCAASSCRRAAASSPTRISAAPSADVPKDMWQP